MIATGHNAIAYAEAKRVNRLWKRTDPTEEARWVTLDEARDIVREDPGLVVTTEMSLTWVSADRQSTIPMGWIPPFMHGTTARYEADALAELRAQAGTDEDRAAIDAGTLEWSEGA